MLKRKNPSLDRLSDSLKIAAPCSVSWDSMQGDDSVRNCSQCNKNVYNISEMTEAEAIAFLAMTGNRACVNYYQRKDGTVLLDNCPVGLKRLRAQYRKLAAAVATAFSILQGLFLSAFSEDGACPPVKSDQRTRGELPMLPDSLAVQTYKAEVASAISAAIPKGIDFGSAALSIGIGIDGSVKTAQLVSKSPTQESDQQILETVRKLKFGKAPDEYFRNKSPDALLIVYFECRRANQKRPLP